MVKMKPCEEQEGIILMLVFSNVITIGFIISVLIFVFISQLIGFISIFIIVPMSIISMGKLKIILIDRLRSFEEKPGDV